MARTELFNRVQPGGVYVIANWKDLPNDGFFVDSVTGIDAAGYGQNPDSPFATLDYAVGRCTASKGDKIYVAPWHVENLTTAISVEANVAGITIEGVRMGNLMPTFTGTLLAGSITVSAANVTLRNLKLVAGVAGGCTAALTIAAGGTGCTLDGIVCRDTTNDQEWLTHVTVATGMADLTIKNCDFVNIAGGTTVRSIFFVGTSANTHIHDNYIFVDASDSVIDHITGVGTNLRIHHNVITNVDAALGAIGYCIEVTACTGVVWQNLLAYNEVTSVVTLGTGMWWFENYANNTIGTSGGVIYPAAVAVP